MIDPSCGIVIERTPMRDVARRLVEVLHDAGIPAWMAARPAVELEATGDLVRATAWDIHVAEAQEKRARGALATGRRRRLVRESLCFRAHAASSN
jgi:hypothetical protein